MKLSKADREWMTSLTDAFLKIHEDAETVKVELYEAEQSLINCMAACGASEVRKAGYSITVDCPDDEDAYLVVTGQTVADLGD